MAASPPSDCTACHNAEDKEGKLDLESYGSLVKGGEHGAVITPESGKDSRLVRMLPGEAKPQMPPEEHERPTAEEIAGELDVPVVGSIAWDPRGGHALVTGGASRWWRRSAHGRSIRSFVDALAAWAPEEVGARA